MSSDVKLWSLTHFSTLISSKSCITREFAIKIVSRDSLRARNRPLDWLLGSWRKSYRIENMKIPELELQ